jgi:hypothetical protein
LIGFCQGLGETFAPGCTGGKTGAGCKAETNARSEHVPRYVANFSGTPNHVIPQ